MMASRWRIEIDPRALKDLRGIDRQKARDVLIYINTRILGSENPRSLGKALRGDLKGYWRYRLGEYRIIARIEDDIFLIMVLEVAHRREVYR